MIGPSSNSNSSSHGLPPHSKAAEAELISKATQTAIVAARSILMNGGSQDVALKTAKAAAESVLNPVTSDSDTVSGRSTLGVAFGGKKRKAKRQAEVVASMALMSATSAHPGGSSMVGDCDISFHNKMYGRNIITVRHDEPSVLSGSINSSRPPKIPTPRSHASPSHNTNSFMGRSQQDEIREGAPNQHASVPRPSHRNRDSRLSNSKPLHSLTQNIRALSPTNQNNASGSANDDEDGETITLRQLDSNSLSQTSTMDSHLQSSMESSRSESEDESDTDSDTMYVRDHLDDKKEKESKKSAGTKPKEKSYWNLGEMLLRPVTATLKLMSCGQITSGEAAGDVDALDAPESYGNRMQPVRARVQTPMFESRDDTFDSCDDSNKRGSYRDQDFTSSYSESYLSSTSTTTDGDSEGEIKVRSSIRDTMESLVTKSNMSYRKSKAKEEKRWASFEKAADAVAPRKRSPRKIATSPRNDSESTRPPKSVISPNNSKNVKNAGRRRSFFKKNRGRRR